jgi:hypothetical protein
LSKEKKKLIQMFLDTLVIRGDNTIRVVKMATKDAFGPRPIMP